MNPETLTQRVNAAAHNVGRHVRLMEVCGTHTHVIGRGGLRSLLPENVDLVSGPGCPVCVTSQRDIERILLLARMDGITLCTFGDMVRVPGVESSLTEERSKGADVRIAYSPMDALDLAVKEPNLNVVFAAVGFETTTPLVASIILQADKLDLENFFIMTSQKLVLPAMTAVLDGESRIDAFISPGHVTVIIGAEAYEPIAQKYSVPCVAAGFEPSDVMEGIAMALECLAEKRIGSFVQYTRVIKPGGNKRARDIMMSVFEKSDAEWRGIGVIPNSGLTLKPEFERFDALEKYDLPDVAPVELKGCRCGEVLKGLIHPPECPSFGKACTPANPLGPCMVSSEGSCSARYKYG